MTLKRFEIVELRCGRLGVDELWTVEDRTVIPSFPLGMDGLVCCSRSGRTPTSAMSCLLDADLDQAVYARS